MNFEYDEEEKHELLTFDTKLENPPYPTATTKDRKFEITNQAVIFERMQAGCQGPALNLTIVYIKCEITNQATIFERIRAGCQGAA